MTVDERQAKVDALFSRWAKSDSPGCALAILQGDDVIYKQGYGMANLEYNIPITPSTVFHVASVSKQFVAAAIALLELDGKLSSSDDIRKHLPELPDVGETITVQHLAHHTSGLRDQWQLLTMAGWRMEDVITTDDILDLVKAQRALNFKPGDEYYYSNTGYTLMGEIVKRVSGKSLRDFCEERIFKPLGMTSTHFHDNYREIVPNRAYSYGERDGGYQHLHLLYSTVGASSLFTTVEDLLKWERNFFDPKVGGAALIERMKRIDPLNDGLPMRYAYGVMVREYRGLPVVDHSGGDAGFRSHLLHFPQQGFAVSLLSNLASVRPLALVQQIADIYLADAFTSAPTPAVQLDSGALRQHEGYYFDARRGEALRLTYDEAQIELKIWGIYALEALDASRFRFGSMSLTFSGGRLTVDDGTTRPALYEKVEPTTLPSLDEYAGVYYSPELDVRYTLAVEDGKLAVRRRKYGSSALLPLDASTFIQADGGYSLSFTRDAADGAVTGFAITDGRVRRLQFTRQPAP